MSKNTTLRSHPAGSIPRCLLFSLVPVLFLSACKFGSPGAKLKDLSFVEYPKSLRASDGTSTLDDKATWPEATRDFQPWQLFDVNDVSYLFSDSLKDGDYLALNEQGSNFLNADAFKIVLDNIAGAAPLQKNVGGANTDREGQIFAHSKKIHDTLKDVLKISDWKATAMRFEPCFKAPQRPDSECKLGEFRLVFQPLRPSPDILTMSRRNPRFPKTTSAFEDYTMHLTYRMESERFLPIIEAIAKLKMKLKALGVETTGRPLFVHPVFENYSKPEIRALGADINALVKSVATDDKLGDVEFLATGGIPESDSPNSFIWTWSTFLVDHVSGKAVPRIHPVGRGVQEDKARGDDPNERNYQSVVMDKVGVYPDMKESKRDIGLFNEIKIWREAVEGGSGISAVGIIKIKERMLEKSISIDDPSKYNIRMMDCVSCHASTMLRMQGVENSMSPTYFGHYFTALGHLPTYLTMMPAYKNEGKPYIHAEYNYHMFSYWMQHPTVSQRSINESIMVADYINRTYADVLKKVYAAP